MCKIRTLAVVGLVLALASCAPASSQLDQWTGQTLEERCADRRARLAALDAIEQHRGLSESERLIAENYRLFVEWHCQPAGERP